MARPFSMAQSEVDAVLNDFCATTLVRRVETVTVRYCCFGMVVAGGDAEARVMRSSLPIRKVLSFAFDLAETTSFVIALPEIVEIITKI